MSSRINCPAVPFELDDVLGRKYRLDDFRGRWLLLVFHRHLAWLPCREHVAELRREEQQLKQLEIDVAVVTFQTGPIVENYVRETDLPWPALVDSDRSLYGAYGMQRGGVWDIWGPASWGTYIRLLLGGRKLHLPAGDVHQLGGDVLIDPRGVVRFHHVSKTPADRPPIASILDVVRQAPAGAGGHA